MGLKNQPHSSYPEKRATDKPKFEVNFREISLFTMSNGELNQWNIIACSVKIEAGSKWKNTFPFGWNPIARTVYRKKQNSNSILGVR